MLLLVVFIILVMTVLVIGYLQAATTETEIMRNHKMSTQALYIAEAGIEDAIYTIRQTGNSQWDAGFQNKEFPAGSGNTYTVVVDNSNYPSVIITSVATVSSTYQRGVEAEIAVSGPPTSAPYPVSMNYWKEA
ncbi:MAG: hypothetical protein V2A72_01230 [Candidatus Omnitrophota bacterium]